MLSDRTLELAVQAQEVALKFMARDPHGNHELGRRAFDAAQKIINRWDEEQIQIYKRRQS